LPPKIAPIQAVITPITKNHNDQAIFKSRELKEKLKSFRTWLDDRDLRPGEKYYEWEKKGVPVRVEIGPKDLEKDSCVLARRDTGEKITCRLNAAETGVKDILADIQDSLYKKALAYRAETNQKVEDWAGLTQAIKKGGYVYAFWCGNLMCELKIKEQLKASIRCQTFDQPKEPGTHYCVCCGKKAPDNRRWVLAKAY